MTRLRERLWNPRDEGFLVVTSFGVGWTANPRGAPYHPLQAPTLAAFVLWQIRRGQGR